MLTNTIEVEGVIRREKEGERERERDKEGGRKRGCLSYRGCVYLTEVVVIFGLLLFSVVDPGSLSQVPASGELDHLCCPAPPHTFCLRQAWYTHTLSSAQLLLTRKHRNHKDIQTASVYHLKLTDHISPGGPLGVPLPLPECPPHRCSGPPLSGRACVLGGWRL